MPFASLYIQPKDVFDVIGMGGRRRIPFGTTSNLDFSLPGLVKDMRRHTLYLPSDGVHLSQLAFLSSVFANYVFPFFFSSYSSCSQTEMTSCRGEVRLNTYPQGPAGEPGSNGRRGICSVEWWDIYQRGKSNDWKNSSWHRWHSLSSGATTRGLKCGKYLCVCWWWGETEDRQIGWEGFNKKGQSGDAINMSERKKEDIKH